MFINKKEKFSIRKFKDGRSDSVKIGTVGLIVGAALAWQDNPICRSSDDRKQRQHNNDLK